MVLVEEEEECKTMKTRVGHRLAHYHCRSGICALEGGARRELRAIRGKAWTFSCVGDNRKEEKKSWALCISSSSGSIASYSASQLLSKCETAAAAKPHCCCCCTPSSLSQIV